MNVHREDRIMLKIVDGVSYAFYKKSDRKTIMRKKYQVQKLSQKNKFKRIIQKEKRKIKLHYKIKTSCKQKYKQLNIHPNQIEHPQTPPLQFLKELRNCHLKNPHIINTQCPPQITHQPAKTKQQHYLDWSELKLIPKPSIAACIQLLHLTLKPSSLSRNVSSIVSIICFKLLLAFWNIRIFLSCHKK